MYKNNKKSIGQRGYSLAEISLVLALVSVVSFAVFKGISVSMSILNQHLARQQAKALVNILRIDFELASAHAPITGLADFWGYLHSRRWPVSAKTLFNVSTDLEVAPPNALGDATVRNNALDDVRALIDANGCAIDVSQFRPCWSAHQGLWLELYAADGSLVQTVYPGFRQASQDRLVAIAMDAQAFQNHYFGQQQIWINTPLEEQAQSNQTGTEQFRRAGDL